MEIFFLLEDQKPNCYINLYFGLDQPVIPMWWRECVLLSWCLMKKLSPLAQLWPHLRLKIIRLYLFKITKNVTGACRSFRLHFLVVWSVASFFKNLVLNYLKKGNIHSLTLPKTYFTKLIVITSICLQRISIKISKHLFFLLFSQLGSCNHDSSAYQGLEAYLYI